LETAEIASPRSRVRAGLQAMRRIGWVWRRPPAARQGDRRRSQRFQV